MTDNEDKNMSFEQAIGRLETIVRALEDGGTPLDESIKLYEEGIRIVRLCNSKLDGARQKVETVGRKDEE